MDELFKDFEPMAVKNIMEELFTGYLNSSERIDPFQLGTIYEFKKALCNRADRYHDQHHCRA